MYIHNQLVLTGNTSYILPLTEPLIIIWGIMTFSFQFNKTSFAYYSILKASVSTYELSLSTYVMALDIRCKKILCT